MDLFYRFGRKTVIIGALMLQGIAGILSSQIMNINVILVLRFLTAVGGAGSFIPSLVFGKSFVKHSIVDIL